VRLDEQRAEQRAVVGIRFRSPAQRAHDALGRRHLAIGARGEQLVDVGSDVARTQAQKQNHRRYRRGDERVMNCGDAVADERRQRHHHDHRDRAGAKPREAIQRLQHARPRVVAPVPGELFGGERGQHREKIHRGKSISKWKRGQSKYGPGSVLRSGAMSAWPTMRARVNSG
jgi:hypothetical protein